MGAWTLPSVEAQLTLQAPAWAANLKSTILEGVREVMKEEMQPLKQEAAELREKMEEVDSSAKAAFEVAQQATALVTKFGAEMTHAPNPEIDKKIENIDAQIKKIGLSKGVAYGRRDLVLS